MKIISHVTLLLAGFFMISACQNSDGKTHLEPVQPTEFFDDQVALGRLLFYERGLSKDSNISCASCHQQKFAFADTMRMSEGVHGVKGFRNSLSLTNLIYKKAFFWDGGVNSIERATIPPLVTDFEMDMEARDILLRLSSNPEYTHLFAEAFENGMNLKSIMLSLTAFQSSIIGLDSPYDNYLNGDKEALSTLAKKGLTLFSSSRLGCAECHTGPLFSDEKFHHLGREQLHSDYGRGRVTLDSVDFNKFITPSLRNVAITAPYMHDGAFTSLDDVINFYEVGGGSDSQKSEKLTTFSLSSDERIQLKAFLHALTDSTVLVNPKWSQPD